MVTLRAPGVLPQRSMTAVRGQPFAMRDPGRDAPPSAVQ
jgi:hypothetical protein